MNLEALPVFLGGQYEAFQAGKICSVIDQFILGGQFSTCSTVLSIRFALFCIVLSSILIWYDGY
jgi:hypothetical protein